MAVATEDDHREVLAHANADIADVRATSMRDVTRGNRWGTATRPQLSGVHATRAQS
jgi:hypothetical protein